MADYDCLERDELLTINGNLVTSERRAARVDRWFQNHFADRTLCRFCSHSLWRAEVLTPDSPDPTEEVVEQCIVWECPFCAFWQAYYYEIMNLDYPAPVNILTVGLMSCQRKFAEPLPQECSGDLIAWLRRTQRAWSSLRPRALECLVADVFRANFTCCEVMHVGQPDDGGKDVVFIDSGGDQWLIQVKHHTGRKKHESVETIRCLLGTLVLNRCPRGIVVSSADHFSYRAYEATRQAASVGYTIRLIDKGKLTRMLDPLLPDHPWLGPLRDIGPTSDEHRNTNMLEILLSERFNRRQLSLFD